jgi:hypothetical protein
MQNKLVCAGRIAMAFALLGTLGCATLLSGTTAPLSINSNPGSADVEIKRMDGIVVKQGVTPMTATLKKGKEYSVSISLEGYETETVAVLKGDIETTAFCNLTDIAGWAIDYVTGAMYKLEPNTINVQLKQVTAQEGEGSVIYAFLTIADEDGTQRHGAVEMTPVAAD